MKGSIALVAMTAACLCSALAAQEAVELLHYETLSIVQPDGVQKPGPGNDERLTFDAFGKRFDIALEQNARLSRAARALGLPSGVVAYRGTLAAGDPGWARIVTTSRGPAGLIWDGVTLYGVEPRGDSLAAAPDRAVIFRLDDVYVPPGAMGCSLAQAPVSGGQAFAALLDEMTPLAATGATLNLDIGAIADFEFHQAFGADAEQALLTRLNNVDGIFSQQLGIQITVREVAVFTSDDDPFTESDAEALLEEVAVYRGATLAQDALGLTHLFTGRDLDGSTAGIAYLGVVCSTRHPLDPLGRSYGSGLSEGRRGSVLDSLVAAHEIGHNFGAPHDAEAASACESTAATFLMAPTINGINQFSACSIEQMQPEIAAATCMTPIGTPDLDTRIADEALVVGAGVAFDYFVDVENLGVDPATSVGVDVAVQSGLDILSAAVETVACSAVDQAASCALEDVPGGTARRLRLTLRGLAPGQFAVSATATAGDDANPDNDTAGGTVTIVPVVDLILSGTAAELEFEMDRRSTLEATLRNESDVSASAVAVTASLSGGLQIESAALAGVACTITAQSIDCAAANLAARAQTELSVVVTGLTTGAEQATVTATATEDERNAEDNSLVLAVQILPTPAPEEQGGGGAISPLWLVVGGLALLRRRRRPIR